MTSTISFAGGVDVVFGIQFDFEVGRVPIAGGHRASRPCFMLDRSLLSCERGPI